MVEKSREAISSDTSKAETGSLWQNVENEVKWWKGSSS